ncbi:MAG TPA: Hpt domain-containing protein [Allosphingosinicella sp.]
MRAAFGKRTQADVAAILSLLSEGESGRGEARRIAHMIAGSAGLFGFAELGAAAAALEDALEAGAGESQVSSLAAALGKSLLTISD